MSSSDGSATINSPTTSIANFFHRAALSICCYGSNAGAGGDGTDRSDTTLDQRNQDVTTVQPGDRAAGAPAAGAPSSPTVPPGDGDASSQEARQGTSSEAREPIHSNIQVVVVQPRAPSSTLSVSALNVMEPQDPKDTQEQQREATKEGTSSKKEDDDNPRREEPREARPGDDGEPARSPARLTRDVATLDKISKLKGMIRSDEYNLTHPFWEKVSLIDGDITKIQVDAIVNAANAELNGGTGVDGAIHNAAGDELLKAETQKCERPVVTGDAVITSACNLSTHVKNIIHCVGPKCHGAVTQDERNLLVSCYRRAFELSEEKGLRSIAFCCISTDNLYGYDNADAARSVIKFLYQYFSKAENVEKWDRVVLCLFVDADKKCYNRVITELLKDNTIFDEEGTMNEDKDEEKDKEKNIKKEDEDKDDKDEEGKEKEKKDEKTDD